jgi:hypothetical protein
MLPLDDIDRVGRYYNWLYRDGLPVNAASLSDTALILAPAQLHQLTVKRANGSWIGWESSNPDVASVDENGLVVAQRAGEAVISAFIGGSGQELYCHVTVTGSAQPTSGFSAVPASKKLKRFSNAFQLQLSLLSSQLPCDLSAPAE